tara:strand:- start:1571 stop:2395 length:825 start_codon:yes stop_codon:yes gene_type:complete
MAGIIKISYNIIVFLILIISSNDLYSKDKFVAGNVAYLPLIENESNDDFYYKNQLVTKVLKKNESYLMFGIPYYSNEGLNEYIFRSNTRKKIINIKVSKKKYNSQYINIEKYATKKNDEQLRIKKERAQLIEAKRKRYREYPDINFIIPAMGVTSGVYGTQRYYNGKKGRFHNGHDIAAEVGTYIFAPSAGKVMLTGDYYYNGKFVMINHGNNLISMFLHMDDISVRNDQIVRKGQKIGTIGNTGYSTGPHLHWSVIANNEYIDPLILIDNVYP